MPSWPHAGSHELWHVIAISRAIKKNRLIEQDRGRPAHPKRRAFGAETQAELPVRETIISCGVVSNRKEQLVFLQ
jgi:hypothetical protein